MLILLIIFWWFFLYFFVVIDYFPFSVHKIKAEDIFGILLSFKSSIYIHLITINHSLMRVNRFRPPLFFTLWQDLRPTILLNIESKQSACIIETISFPPKNIYDIIMDNCFMTMSWSWTILSRKFFPLSHPINFFKYLKVA